MSQSATQPATLDQLLGAATFVDLSHPLGPDTVRWPGSPVLETTDLATFRHDDYFARTVHVFEHAGTHFDAPCHMVEDGATLETVPASKLIAPLVRIDISEAIHGDPDAVLTTDHVLGHEKEFGTVPAGSVVVLRTGWEERAGVYEEYAGAEGTLRFPGFGVKAAALLVERGVIGLGIDTLGIDAGCAPHFPVHRQVSHPRGLWHLENLTNTAALPATGAWIVVGVVGIVGASGFPARVMAIVPGTGA